MKFKELRNKYYQITEIPTKGKYSENEYLWFIEKQENWKVDNERGFFHFGNAGCDGIEFGLRAAMKGIWAYYPIENEYKKIAESIPEFIYGWTSGEIQV